MSLQTIDVFSGCGGLTLGLRRAGFAVRVAIDNDEAAVATFRASHPKTETLLGDVRRLAAESLRSRAGGNIDLLVGCAPCQGFTSLTSKWRREDERNDLVLEMARLVETLKPRALFMENVPGLETKGASIFREFLRRIGRAGYLPTQGIVQMADFGVPQNRRRFVLIAGRGFTISLPKPTHAKNPEPSSRLKPWVTVREAIGGFEPPTKLSEAERRGGPQAFFWHVVSDLEPQTQARLRAAKPGETWVSMNESLRPECHRGGYNGFTNVYGRMRWDDVSPTITSGCVTPCKGRFGHPDRRRTTISVREAALLQTFPIDYRFETDSIAAATRLVGNAVPPLFAELVGREIRRALQRQYGKVAN